YAWLAPRFDAASRALTRRHEYAADAAAARAVGAEATAGALLRVEIVARRLQARFWPRLWARARSQRHPPAQLLAPLAQAARGEGDDADVDVERVLAAAAHAHDPLGTHPHLAQRLQALRAPARLRPAGAPATQLLGPLEDALERRLAAAW